MALKKPTKSAFIDDAPAPLKIKPSKKERVPKDRAPRPPMIQETVYFPKPLWDAIENQRRESFRDFSSAVRDLILDGLKARDATIKYNVE